MEDKVLRTMESLKSNGIKASCFETANEAVEYLMSSIQQDSSVGVGGSMTIKSIGIVDRLKDRGNEVLFHWLAETKEEVLETRRKAFNADIYLSSTNALTMDGKLINIDGIGNRVASMFFGPNRVFIVCGVNKIAENVDKGIERIEDNAYKNAERLKLNTPCVKTKKCIDCRALDRMCNITVIISKKPPLVDMEVLIINEELGY